MVLLQAGVFLVALVFAPKHGLLAARRQRLHASVGLPQSRRAHKIPTRRVRMPRQNLSCRNIHRQA
jgi:hypothetical protein